MEKKWKRWVLLGDLKKLADIARDNGMRCICGFTVPMFVHSQIGLYGTSAQMRLTEEHWKKVGYEFTNRQPSYAYSIEVDIPKDDWVDKPNERPESEEQE